MSDAHQLHVVEPGRANIADVPAIVEEKVAREHITVRGECRGPAPYAGGWTVDVSEVDGNDVSVVKVRIDQGAGQRITSLRRGDISIREMISDGKVVVVEGELHVDPDTSQVYLAAQRLEPADLVEGPLGRRNRTAIAALRAEGADEKRLSGNDIHCRWYGDAPWPEQLAQITVLGSQYSEGLIELRRAVKWAVERNLLRVTEAENLGVESPNGTGRLVRALDAITPESADVVFVVRGGEDWRQLTAFDDPELAKAIHRCRVPVFTAIGHTDEITLADRAAAASFITPSAMGDAAVTEATRRIRERQLAHAGTKHADRVKALEHDRSAINAGLQNLWTAHVELLRIAGRERVRSRAMHLASGWLLAFAVVFALMILFTSPTGKGFNLGPLLMLVTLGGALVSLYGVFAVNKPVAPNPYGPTMPPMVWLHMAATAKTPKAFRRVWSEQPPGPPVEFAQPWGTLPAQPPQQ